MYEKVVGKIHSIYDMLVDLFIQQQELVVGGVKECVCTYSNPIMYKKGTANEVSE